MEDKLYLLRLNLYWGTRYQDSGLILLQNRYPDLRDDDEEDDGLVSSLGLPSFDPIDILIGSAIFLREPY